VQLSSDSFHVWTAAIFSESPGFRLSLSLAGRYDESRGKRVVKMALFI
jgi:hypothetical protein